MPVVPTSLQVHYTYWECGWLGFYQVFAESTTAATDEAVAMLSIGTCIPDHHASYWSWIARCCYGQVV